ncbi:T9SS type B sorting domain-containing protein, partial [Pseudotenacibaculum haliotis]
NDPDGSDDSDTNTPVPVPQSDLSIVKTISDPAPLIGDTVVFTLTVSNSGPSDATGVVVNDLLPNGFTYVSDTPSVGTYNSVTGVWTIGNVTSGVTETLQMSVIINATGSYANTATVSGDQNDPDGSDNSDTNTPVPGAPKSDLSIVKTVNDATPNVGDNITFTLTVSNSGPSNATGVVVNDLLPDGYTYVSNNPSVGTYNSGTGVWTIGNLNTGSSETLDITALVKVSGNYANTATVSGVEADPDVSNNSDTNTPTPTCVNPTAPVIENSTQPTCIVTTGSVEFSGLPASGTWTITESLGNSTIVGTGTTAVFSGLAPGTYTFTVQNSVGCVSSPSASVEIALPPPPADPVAIAQEFCGVATIADLNGNVPLGSELIWYTMASGGSPLVSSTTLTSTTYYAVSRDTTTGCESSRVAVNVTVKEIPTFALGTIGQVTTCSGSDGSIQLTGLNANTQYALSYSRNGIVVNTSINSDGSGNINIGNLPVGSYTNFQVNLDGCDSSVLAGPVVISEPIPAVIGLESNSNPTTCSGTDGIIQINGLDANAMYAVSYEQDGTQINTNLMANGSGIIAIENLPAGNYTNIQVESNACESNVLPGVILEDPTTPTLTLDAVNDPLTCNGTGSIEFTGLAANTNYTFVYTYNGTNSNTMVMSDGVGRLIVSSLSPGLYENMRVIFAGCVSNTIDRAVINPPTISLGAVVNPAQCGLTGSFEILGLVANENYTVTYTLNGNNQNQVIMSDATGSITVNNLIAGTYTNIEVEDQSNCTSNAIASVDIIEPNAPAIALGTTVNPDSCIIDNGSIQITGLNANESYSLSYDLDGNNTMIFAGTDGSGNITLTDLPAGNYTNIVATSLISNCQSNALSITLNQPTAPTNPNVMDQEFCGAAFVGDLLGTVGTGQIINWYDQATGGSPLALTTALATGTYYASTFDLTSNCESGRSAISVTINGCSDLRITKTVNNTTPNVGDELTFTITIRNDGPDVATGVSIQDVLPVGYSNIANISNGGIENSNTIDWTNLTVPLNGLNLSYTATVLAPTGTADEYKNVVQITASDNVDLDSTPNNDDGDQSEDDEDAVVIVPQVADLSISKTVSNANPNVGDEITFEVVITNNGPDDATNVSIEDNLPEGFTYVVNSVTNGGVFDSASNQIVWSALDLGTAQAIVLSYSVNVNAPSAFPIPVDEYRNTAQVRSSDQYDPDSSGGNDDGDQSEDDEAFAAIVPQISDLSLQKTVNNTSANIGDIVTFTLTLSNDGPDDATNVQVTDNLPIGFLYVTHSGGDYNPVTGIWNVGDFANGTSQVLTIDVEVLPPTGATDEYNNVAEITSADQYDPDSDVGNGGGSGEDDDDSSDIIIASIDLSIGKTVNDQTPVVNNNVVFTITLQNNSVVEASNILVEDILPSGYEYVSHTTSNGAYDEFLGEWRIVSLSGNGSATLSLEVKVNESGDYTNITNIISADQPDSDSSNNSASASTVPVCLTIYNEFSPNGDGVNDFFVIDCIDQYPNNTLEILNRWGNTVFKKRNYDNSWDGTSTGRATINAGEKLPVGTYYYVLDLGNGSKPKTGWIYLNR